MRCALEMKRLLKATPPVVCAACSNSSALAKWFGPRGFTLPRLEFEPRVGDSYRIEMQPPEGDPFCLTGKFRVVDPPVRLSYTFVWEDPDPDDAETLVVLLFRGLHGSTEVPSHRARSRLRHAAPFTTTVGRTASTSLRDSSACSAGSRSAEWFS
jgi:uncharacterized protein YndB with AHSA1/START domain